MSVCLDIHDGNGMVENAAQAFSCFDERLTSFCVQPEAGFCDGWAGATPGGVAAYGGGARGEMKPSRRFEITAPDVRHIRNRFSASQSQFADIIGVSINTIQNWEQGRCVPTGPARVLLAVADRNPELLIKTIDAERAEDKRSLVFA